MNLEIRENDRSERSGVVRTDFYTAVNEWKKEEFFPVACNAAEETEIRKILGDQIRSDAVHALLSRKRDEESYAPNISSQVFLLLSPSIDLTSF